MLWCWLLSAALADEPDPTDPSAEVDALGSAERSESRTRLDPVALERSGVELTDILPLVPGAAVRRGGGLGAVATVALRGAGARHTEVFLDGVPLNPEGVSAVNLSELSLSAFEEVQVYRGGGPLALNASPLGGVLVLQTRRDGNASVRLGAGSLSTFEAQGHGELGRTWYAFQGFRTGGAFTYLDDNATRFNGDDDTLRVRQNNDRQQVTGHTRTRVGEWSVVTSHLLREEGVPGYLWSPTSQVRNWVVQERVGLALEPSGAGNEGGVSAWAGGRWSGLTDPAAELFFLPQEQQERTLDVGGRAHGSLDGGWLVPVGSVEPRFAAMRVDGTNGAVNAQRAVLESTVGAEAEGPGGIKATVRSNQAWLRDDGTTGVNTDLLWSPGVGLWVPLTEPLSIRANVVQGSRAPDLTEKFGNQGALVGNPELVAERGVQADLGLRLDTSGVGLEVGGFVGRTRDRVTWLQNSQGIARPVNLDRTEVAGAEVGSSLTGAGWTWIQSATWTESRQVSTLPAYDGQRIPGLPRWAWHHHVGWSLGAFDWTYTLDHQSGVRLDAAGVQTAPARWLHGSGLAWSTGRLQWRVEGFNLTNQRVGWVPRDPLSSSDARVEAPLVDYLGLPLPGRTVMGSVRMTL